MRRLLRWSVVATLAAGLLGVARHRRDVARVRRGELPPASAVGEVEPLRPAGLLASRLADWVPAPPRTAVGRVAGELWAAPLTLPGMVLALASGVRPRWSHEYGCWIAVGVGGPSAAALRLVGADANAIGKVVLCRGTRPGGRLLAHEVVHVRQAERLGAALFPLYLWLAARYGYRDHPLERAARLGARRAA